MISTLNRQISWDKCLYLVSTGSIWYDSNKNAGFKGKPSVCCFVMHGYTDTEGGSP